MLRMKACCWKNTRFLRSPGSPTCHYFLLVAKYEFLTRFLSPKSRFIIIQKETHQFFRRRLTPGIRYFQYHMNHEKKRLYFPWNTGYLIGILIIRLLKFPYNLVAKSPIYNPSNPVVFHCSNNYLLVLEKITREPSWKHPHVEPSRDYLSGPEPHKKNARILSKFDLTSHFLCHCSGEIHKKNKKSSLKNNSGI